MTVTLTSAVVVSIVRSRVTVLIAGRIPSMHCGKGFLTGFRTGWSLKLIYPVEHLGEGLGIPSLSVGNGL